MPRAQDQLSEGHIDGLLLTRHAWTALARQGIGSLDHLLSVLDTLERLPGIGLKTASQVRAEVVRVMKSRGDGSPPPPG